MSTSDSSNDMNQSQKSGGDAMGSDIGVMSGAGAMSDHTGGDTTAGSDATGVGGGNAADNTSIGSIEISS